ncbi:LysR family transcriptional regulator [Oxalobacteraceae bacterium OM1]|nr:LysR family transcriptional regulator [Oxalobacteraceae bacterium OM1]
MNIELRQLRYFIAVAEENHFGRAAVRLHMTQPPLSQTIQALEAALGAPLFDRTRRRVELTAAGRALLPEARRILQQAAELPDLARRAQSGEAGTLSLSFVSTADYSVLPSLLREFRERYPQVRIDLREATTDVQLDDLMQGRIDAGLLIPPLQDKEKADLEYTTVLSEPLVLAAPDSLAAVAGKTATALKAVADQPLVIFPRRIAPAFHDAILGCFRDAGLTPRIGQEAIQMQTIVSLVSAGLGVALVPQSVRKLQRPGVAYLTLSGKVPAVETGLAWRRDNASPVLQRFLELIRKPR